MKKNSCIALGASLLLFLAAGTVKFWPQERFTARSSIFSGGIGSGAPIGVSGYASGLIPIRPSFPSRPDLLQRDLSMSSSHSGNVANPAAPGFTPGQTGLPIRAPEKKEAPTGIVLVAQNMPVGDILAQLFHKAGVAYSFTGRWKEPMTITFDGATLDQALSQTLSLTQRPRLMCLKEIGVYLIMPVPNSTEAMEAYSPSHSPTLP